MALFIILFLIGCFILLVGIILCARLLKAQKTKIRTQNGIQENTSIILGGIKQHISIRGENKDNPVILVLHGGPGSPIGYISYFYQAGLETDYTFVNWDQRGCGRTYFLNRDMDIDTELTVDILLKDLDELVDYLRKRFLKDKIIIMGQSWGSVIGSKYALSHPEKVSDYIGVGQVVDTSDGEKRAANEAIKKAIKKGKTQDAERLSNALDIFLKAKTYDEFDSKNFMLISKLNAKYLDYDGSMPLYKILWTGITSPDISWHDIRWFLKLNYLDTTFVMQRNLSDHIFFHFNLYKQGLKYEIPIYFISGKCDWVTPYTMVQEFYESVNAPDKNIVLVENAGHSLFLDDQRAFSFAVKSLLGNKGIKLDAK